MASNGGGIPPLGRQHGGLCNASIGLYCHQPRRFHRPSQWRPRLAAAGRWRRARLRCLHGDGGCGLVIGRKTFETVLAFDTWPYGAKPVFVLTTGTLPPAPRGAVVERMSGAPAEIVSQLAAREVRHVYVDGGITIQRFLQAGLIQRLIITRIPVLIGAGIPLFGATQSDILLVHVGTRQYASGLVQSEYLITAS